MPVCLLLALVACGIAPTAPAPTALAPTAAPTRIWLAPGERMRLPIEPRTGPTEESPTLTFHILVTDELRQTPVIARRVLLGGKEIAHNVSEFVMQLPGDIQDHPLLLQIEADGYEPWGLVLRQRINYSRHIYWGIPLRPKGPSAMNGAPNWSFRHGVINSTRIDLMGRLKDGRLQVAEIGQADQVPEGWWDASIVSKPVPITNLFTALFFLILKMVLGG